jgi:hypothetical protein
LQRQVEKLGGKAGSMDDIQAAGSDPLYPSIRKLPLLGVQYADLLRNSKVQEAVFEALTQQYEIAKVTEAKELPSVKILDPPNIPERKSSPPRRVIAIVGTLLALGGGILWILLSDRWRRTDPRDPTKSFVTRICSEFRHDLPWVSRNGAIAISSRASRATGDMQNPEARTNQL